MIDLSTEEAIARYHIHVLRIMLRLEKIAAVRLRPFINRQYIDAAKLIESGVRDTDQVIANQTRRLRKILREHYYRTAFTAGREASRAYDPEKSMGEDFWREVNRYVAVNTAKKVSQINSTTRKSINAIIKKGLDEGLPSGEVAKLVRKRGLGISRIRAIRIARTETGGIYNAATKASVKDTGRKYIKIWSTTRDDRAREDHTAVNGQKRPMDVDFDVGGEKLDHPLDPKGSAKNIVNCRCVMMFKSVKGVSRRF